MQVAGAGVLAVWKERRGNRGKKKKRQRNTTTLSFPVRSLEREPPYYHTHTHTAPGATELTACASRTKSPPQNNPVTLPHTYHGASGGANGRRRAYHAALGLPKVVLLAFYLDSLLVWVPHHLERVTPTLGVSPSVQLARRKSGAKSPRSEPSSAPPLSTARLHLPRRSRSNRPFFVRLQWPQADLASISSLQTPGPAVPRPDSLEESRSPPPTAGTVGWAAASLRK